MSIAYGENAWNLAFRTTTVRQFRRAVSVALGVVGAGCLIYAVEKYALGLEKRFIENPADVMMRAFALAHFVIGWLFLFTSPRIRNRQSLSRIAVATLGGVGLCLIFARFGGTSNPLLVMFFYGYFLVHSIRDEAGLYRTYGDAPADEADSRFQTALSRTAMLLMMTILMAGYLAYVTVRGKPTALDRLPSIRFGLVAVPALACLAYAIHLVQVGRRQQGSWLTALDHHLPLLLVYAGILSMLLFGAPFGSTGFNFIILVHVTSWLVFVHYQLGKTSPRSTRNPWQWLRTTPSGFLLLHVGVALVVLILMAVRVHVWHRVGLVSELLASSSFCYWGLMHISMAFGSPK